jgi:hypothetical protein
VVPSNGPLQRVLFRISRPEGPIKGVPFSYPPPKFYPGLSFKWVTSRVPLHRGPSSDPLQEYTITCPLHGIHLRCSSTRSSPGCPLQMVPFRGTLPGRSSWGIPSANSPQGGRLPRVPTRGATHGPFHENPWRMSPRVDPLKVVLSRGSTQGVSSMGSVKQCPHKRFPFRKCRLSGSNLGGSRQMAPTVGPIQGSPQRGSPAWCPLQGVPTRGSHVGGPFRGVPFTCPFQEVPSGGPLLVIRQVPFQVTSRVSYPGGRLKGVSSKWTPPEGPPRASRQLFPCKGPLREVAPGVPFRSSPIGVLSSGFLQCFASKLPPLCQLQLKNFKWSPL